MDQTPPPPGTPPNPPNPGHVPPSGVDYPPPQQPYGPPPQPYGAPQQPYGAPPPPFGAQQPPQQPFGAQPPFGAPQQPFGTPPPVVTPPPAKKGVLGRFTGLIVLLVIGAVVFGLAWYNTRDKVENAKVGDCVKVDSTDDKSPYTTVDCTDPEAKLKVLSLIEENSAQKCQDVAGASQSSTRDGKEVCMGDKDVDPATAINVAKEGDCLAVKGDDAQKLDCAAAEAEYKVLKRLEKVSTIGTEHACDKVDGAEAYYSWTWESTGGTGIKVPSFTIDVLLCLGKK